MDNPLTLPFEAAERWLPVVGYEGMYEISDHGNVRSIPRITPHGHRRKGQPLKPYVHHYGYLMATLCRNGKLRSFAVHTLVAAAFIGPCPEGMEVCHGPNGKLDNRPGEICYGTRAKNMGPDRLRDGTLPRGEECKRAKLTDAAVIAIRLRYAAGERPAALAREYGVSWPVIKSAATRQTWRHVT